MNCAAFRIVDKLPDNYLYLGPLAGLFPRAKFIHCRRDFRDVAVSCWMTHFGEICWANDQQDIASRFRDYQRMMAHGERFCRAVLDMDYEETVADLEGVARRLVAWCGLAWEPTCLNFQEAKRPVERPAPSRSASRSMEHRSQDGGTTKTLWVGCSRAWKAWSQTTPRVGSAGLLLTKHAILNSAVRKALIVGRPLTHVGSVFCGKSLKRKFADRSTYVNFARSLLAIFRMPR